MSTNCCVCLDPIEGRVVTLAPCGDRAHAVCYAQWCYDPDRAQRCPKCDARVRSYATRDHDASAALRETDCSICYESLAAGSEAGVVQIDGCRHVFHDSCLADWAAASPAGKATCPICRREDITTSPVKLPAAGDARDRVIEQLIQRIAVPADRQQSARGAGQNVRPASLMTCKCAHCGAAPGAPPSFLPPAPVPAATMSAYPPATPAPATPAPAPATPASLPATPPPARGAAPLSRARPGVTSASDVRGLSAQQLVAGFGDRWTGGRTHTEPPLVPRDSSRAPVDGDPEDEQPSGDALVRQARAETERRARAREAQSRDARLIGQAACVGRRVSGERAFGAYYPVEGDLYAGPPRASAPHDELPSSPPSAREARRDARPTPHTPPAYGWAPRPPNSERGGELLLSPGAQISSWPPAASPRILSGAERCGWAPHRDSAAETCDSPPHPYEMRDEVLSMYGFTQQDLLNFASPPLVGALDLEKKAARAPAKEPSRTVMAPPRAPTKKSAPRGKAPRAGYK